MLQVGLLTWHNNLQMELTRRELHGLSSLQPSESIFCASCADLLLQHCSVKHGHTATAALQQMYTNRSRQPPRVLTGASQVKGVTHCKWCPALRSSRTHQQWRRSTGHFWPCAFLCTCFVSVSKVGGDSDQAYHGVVSAAREWTTKHPNETVKLKNKMLAVDKQWCLQMAHPLFCNLSQPLQMRGSIKRTVPSMPGQYQFLDQPRVQPARAKR